MRGKALLLAGSASIIATMSVGSMPRAMAQTQASTSAAFQTVTIRESQPGSRGFTINIGRDNHNFRVHNYTLRKLIAFAFDSQDGLISGPGALDAKYDVEATAPAPFPTGYQGFDAARAMVRSLLANQFQLMVHRGTQSIIAYALTRTGASGLLKPAAPGELGPVMHLGPSSIRGTALRMDTFVQLLVDTIAQPVVDQTGLIETYDFNVDWKPDSGAAPPDVTPEVLSSALEKQVGLTLQLAQNAVEVLIVDSVQSPKDLAAARKPIPMDPTLFDFYVGHYAFPNNVVMSVYRGAFPDNLVMTVYRDHTHFYTQLSGQRPVEVFPEAQGDFFAKVVDVQISFQLDAQGRASGLVLHQNGRDIAAPRVDDAKAEQLAEGLKNRVQQQVAAPGSQHALRQHIQDVASGKPDYGRMSPDLAAATRQQLVGLQRSLTSLGALMSLEFKGVGPQGDDIYQADFEHGSEEWRISLNSDGKIGSASVQPAR
jgi:uncharacterized protein (TIGR03435 family)